MAEMNPTAKIAKNSLVQLIAGIANKVLGVALVIYAARQLGTDGFGTYSFVLSMYAIFYILTDFGLGTLTTRDIAQNSEKETIYFGNVLIIRILLSFIASLGMVASVWVLGHSPGVVRLTSIAALSFFFMSNIDTCTALFNAHQRMEIPATITVVASTLRVTASLGALAAGAWVTSLIWIHTITSILHFVIIFFILVHFIRPTFRIDTTFWKKMLKEAYPLALANMFSIIYFRIDTVMLASIKGESAVGIYNAAYRLLEFTLIFPAYYGGAVFPVIASSYKNNMQRFLLIYRRSMKYMWVMALPMALGVMAISPKLIHVLYGPEYQSSVPILSVLMWSLIFIAVNGVSAPYLIVMGKHKFVTYFCLSVMLLNVVLNFIVIPRYGALGAATVTLVCEVINIALYIILLKKPLSLTWRLIRHLIRPMLAGAAMYGGLYLIRHWDLGFQVLIGAVLYVGFLFLFRSFDEVDYELFDRILKPRSKGNRTVT